MGIPMYSSEPSPAEEKSSVKNDPCARARSTIRRRGAVRHRVPRAGGSVSLRPFLHRQVTSEISRDLERDSHAHYHRARSPVLGSTPGNQPFLDPTSGSPPLDPPRRERLLREALRHGRRPRIPRESSLRFEMPSPPWSTSDILRRASPPEDPNSRPPSDHPHFTPRFAPAFAYHSEISSQPHPDVAPLSPFPRWDTQSGEDALGSNTRFLRRVGRRSINETQLRPPHRPIIDGLGDRQRSFSPEDDHETDAWETLLNTITPDAQLPSADSSFTSTVASASASLTRNSESARLSNIPPTQSSSVDSTIATMRLVLDPYPELFNPCDFPTSSDSDTEADSDLDHRPLSGARRHHRTRTLPELQSLRNSQSLGWTQDGQPPLPSTSFSFSQDTADPDLQQMQAILHRLSRRDDIPDEWWAGAGLSRTMGRHLGAGEEHRSSNNNSSTTRQT